MRKVAIRCLSRIVRERGAGLLTCLPAPRETAELKLPNLHEARGWMWPRAQPVVRMPAATP